MTQDYVNGFFTKCAEHRIPYDLAVAMYKRAQSVTPGPNAPSRSKNDPVMATAKAMVDRSRPSMRTMSRMPSVPGTPVSKTKPKTIPQDVKVSVRRRKA